jgi:hypothetical protein
VKFIFFFGLKFGMLHVVTPATYRGALSEPAWRSAMEAEFDALQQSYLDIGATTPRYKYCWQQMDI